MKWSALHILLFFLFHLPFAQAQNKHTYRFNNDLKVAQPECGPDLSFAKASGSCPAGTIPGIFAQEVLPCGGRRVIYHNNLNWGFMYPNSDGLVTETYTIQLYLKVTDWGNEWARIIDFSNGSSDNGIYFKNLGGTSERCLDFYPNGIVGECPFFNTSTYYLLTFTRDGATGQMDVYVDNKLFATYIDKDKNYVGKTGAPIYIFRDDNAQECESGEANFAYLAFHNKYFSKTDVDKSFSEICFEATINAYADFSIAPNPTCEFPKNIEVKYTGSIPAPGTSYDFKWDWDGGTVVSGSGMGPYVLSWNSPGTKNVTLTVANKACGNSLYNRKQLIISDLGLTTAVTLGNCSTGSNGTITLTATNGLTPFRYSIDSVNYQTSNIFQKPAGNYRVFVKDGNDCVVGNDVNLKFESDISVRTSGDTTICEGQSAQLRVENNGDSFSWSPQTGLNNPNSLEPVATPTVTTQYVITVGRGSCTQTDTIQVNVAPKIEVQVTPDAVIDYNVPFQLNATSPQIGNHAGTTFLWTPADGLNNANIPSPIAVLQEDRSYTVNVTSELGCTGSGEVNLFIKRQENIIIPTAFSPNGDGRNEALIPVVNGIESIRFFRVYNRWGQVVFSTNQLNVGWDGTFKGTAATSGTYIWEIEGVSTKGKVISKKGAVMLLQ
ncbi:gliding motility-associated C-terminal domain-containing protein [Dyadobacter sp. CY261]|uniref:T9SS type B sorting domain-containing protein n=1 Tax=Dyadobacter sp. CY261 TaxID=2907203 RepID=UPI001F1E55F9|nr:gliding motility-associated C-terminal domain-containing protein [Dyadobacter sp. CY261]MCF0070945.1 gliding motility-associated C-terminal domain-containing protein [Dyadobacter sp. CY261]